MSEMSSLDENTLNSYEKKFIEIYGLYRFHEIYNFILSHNILDIYNKSHNTPDDLFHFGFHYGILPIVSFCYCVLRIPLEIHQVIDGYFKTINSTTPENGNKHEIPLIHSPGAADGMVIATLDVYTANRSKCRDYLIRMIKFSKCERVKNNPNEKLKYIYTIVDKYIDSYHLLEV